MNPLMKNQYEYLISRFPKISILYSLVFQFSTAATADPVSDDATTADFASADTEISTPYPDYSFDELDMSVEDHLRLDDSTVQEERLQSIDESELEYRTDSGQSSDSGSKELDSYDELNTTQLMNNGDARYLFH